MSGRYLFYASLCIQTWENVQTESILGLIRPFWYMSTKWCRAWRYRIGKRCLTLVKWKPATTRLFKIKSTGRTELVCHQLRSIRHMLSFSPSIIELAPGKNSRKESQSNWVLQNEWQKYMETSAFIQRLHWLTGFHIKAEKEIPINLDICFWSSNSYGPYSFFFSAF